MTIFIRGSDKGSIFMGALALLFIIFLLLTTLLEVEYRAFVRAKSDYEKAVLRYEIGRKYEAD